MPEKKLLTCNKCNLSFSIDSKEEYVECPHCQERYTYNEAHLGDSQILEFKADGYVKIHHGNGLVSEIIAV